MDIAKCRLCGNNSTVQQDDDNRYYVKSLCEHTIYGPSCETKEEAISMWNEMMMPFITGTLDNTSTDYRDRVDRIAAAILAGYYANPGYGKIEESRIVELAIYQIDRIDKALAEREAKS